MTTRFKLILSSIFLLLACFAFTTASAQYFEMNRHRKQITLPFRLIRNMVIIQLQINGQGPFNFVLDTGVGLMIITDPYLIDSLNLQDKHTLKLLGFGKGEEFEAFAIPLLKVEIPGMTSIDVGAAIFKKDHFGLSNYAGIPIHGLLGYEFFNKLVVKLNFEDHTLTAYRPGKFKCAKKFDRIALSIKHNKPYINAPVYFCDSTKRNFKLMVDIGAGFPLSLENNHQNKYPTGRTISANLGLGLTGPVSGEISRVNQLTIGKFALNNVLSSFPDNRSNTLFYEDWDGNIGLDVLKRFEVVFDYQNEAMYLKPISNLKAPFIHDMSGIEYYSDGTGLKRVFISRVESGSSANEVGLKKDDELLSINFKPVADMDLEELDRLFSSQEGRNFFLLVIRDHKCFHTILTLKSRI